MDSKIKTIFAVCTFINLFNFIDRGIIPGSTNEFNAFIVKATNTSQPDVLLGLLQSSFVIGFLVGAILFGHLIHHYGRFLLTRTGCTIWIFAVFFSGISFYTNSYAFLLICRMFSGFGEASLQCTVPPWIQANAGNDSKGIWLSVFYTAVPVGTALGYAYSSLMTSAFGWQFAFFGECIISIPFVFYLYLLPEERGEMQRIAKEEEEEERETELVPVIVTGPPTTGSDPLQREEIVLLTTPKPTILEELVVVCRRPIYLCFIFGLAAQTATLIGLSTFGSAFLLGLGYFDLESQASSMFGILISVAGVVGVPFGGYCLDSLTRQRITSSSSSSSTTNNNDHGEGNDPTRSAPVNEKMVMEVAGCWSYWANYFGVLLFCCLYFVQDKTAFLTVITLAAFAVFSSSTCLNMATMISVPVRHQSFAIAFACLIGHLFGDVPSPIFAGWLKDMLAPGCISDSGEMNSAASDSCRADEEGLRMTMFLVSVWMYWTAILFGLAWHLIKSS
jgi:MFS family permease